MWRPLPPCVYSNNAASSAAHEGSLGRFTLNGHRHLTPGRSSSRTIQYAGRSSLIS
jgi:hypothetical protein